MTGLAAPWRGIDVFAAAALVLGAAQVVYFAMIQTTQPLMAVLLTSLWCLVVLGVLRGIRRPVCGRLAWDGLAWQWSGAQPEARCTVSVHLDLNRVVLVAVQINEQSKVWLWLEAKQQPLHWLALRRALFGNARGH